MQTIFVSPDFPLNRRMRKAVRRGKLQVVREGEKRLSLGGGMPVESRRAFRTHSSPLVCMADNGAESGGGRGNSAEGGQIPFSVDRKTALELFGENIRYWVPLYQRRYRWGKEQWEDFWGDIYGENGESRYPSYTGNIVLRAGGASDKLEIIDGQQRLTSIVLFAIAAVRVLWNGGQGIAPLDSPIREIANAFIAEGGLGDNIGHRLKITPNQRPTADFLANLTRLVKPTLPFPKGAGEVDQTRMRSAVEFFMEKQRSASEVNSSPEAIRRFVFEKMGGNLIFSRVVTGVEIRPHPVFAALNARGVSLKIHELIENYCLSLCGNEEAASREREWENFIRRIGKRGQLNEGDKEMSVFLRAVFTCAHGRVPESRFYRGFSKEIRSASGVSAFFGEMNKHASLYRGIVEPNKYEWPGECDKERIVMLFTLRAVRHRALILAAREKFNDSDFSETLRHCYAIFLRNRICGGPAGAAELPEFAFHNAAHWVYTEQESTPTPQGTAEKHLVSLYRQKNKFLRELMGYQLPDGNPGKVTPRSVSGRLLTHFFRLLEKHLGNEKFDPGHMRHVPYSETPDPQMHLGNWHVLESPALDPARSQYMTSKLTAGMSRDNRQKFLATLAAGCPDGWEIPDWRDDIISAAEAEQVRELLRTGIPDWRIDCLEDE